ncbi:hypothetical protein WJX72_010543 [[Myrmecia] bisecta]|uniref:Leucine aminopeptidase n=1 Tax=[Myrmecia] bisecta TaxID=41462 RepID=A0AAW1Q8I4_9CHLO
MVLPTDHSSFANFREAKVTHSDLDLKVDFEGKSVSGSVRSQVTFLQPGSGPSVVDFDTQGLAIHRVFLADSGAGSPLSYHLHNAHKVLGSKLSVEVPRGTGQTAEIGIEFTTGPNSSALQFLEPEQTAGGKQPYLFTQCQAIHARSFLPCQDTPAVKFTYTARVTVPSGLTALMSALPAEEAPSSNGEAGTRTFAFKQPIPIPSYLLALAVGDLESRQLGPRSKVWSEPSMVEAGLYEFQDTEAFLAAGESLAGPYRWGTYDLLLLPPSFCYGGMENPQLTFVTPTLLAGDRSLANVVAHEIAHSWTGNLVTNASWQDFFLNEGMTVYLERRILGKLYGESTYQFHAATGYMSLQETVESLGQDHPFTALVPDLSGGIDPDEAFSKVPYEKGAYLMHYLQELVGGVDSFIPFLKAYLAHFALGSVTTADFKQFFLDFFARQADPQIDAALKQIDWQTWLHAPGMPPPVNTYDTSLADQAFALAKAWHLADVMGIGGNAPESASSTDLQGWSSAQVVAFLDKFAQLRGMQAPHPRVTRQMNELYGFDASKNAEIRASWYKLCITAGDEAVFGGVAQFLREQGRMKYLRPLYRALFRSKGGKQLALETFRDARSGYHPIAAKMVAADLQVS